VITARWSKQERAIDEVQGTMNSNRFEQPRLVDLLKLRHREITSETKGISCRKGLRKFGNCSDGLQNFPIDIQHTGTKYEDVRMHRLEMLRVIY